MLFFEAVFVDAAFTVSFREMRDRPTINYNQLFFYNLWLPQIICGIYVRELFSELI